MKTIVTEVFTASEQVNDGRTLQDVLTHMITEVGELAQEIQIDTGKSNRLPSADGVVGEAIDVVACALDVIHLQSPSLTEEDLVAIMQLKLQKWKDTV
jgi:NTP pyrophosphatase (non-canonical NTP hydrolase)